MRTSPTTKAAITLAALTALTSACSAPAPAARDASRTLQVAGQFEVHSLEPATAGGTFTRLQVAETLVDADDDGVLQPGLATEWEASADQRSWTFELADGAVFHDGSPVTAQQVVASLERARTSEGTPLADVPWKTLTVAGEAVRIELTEPFASLPAALAHSSAQVLAASSYGPDGKVTQVIGSGPYEVAKVQIPSSVDLVAAEQWRGDEPAVERIAYQVVGRAEARALRAESGQADITFGMDPTSLVRLKGKRGLKIESATVPRTITMKANAEHPALSDVRALAR